MIRRSTLVLLTCLGALAFPAMSISTVMAKAAVAETAVTETAVTKTPVLMAQASEAVTSNVLSIGSRGRAVRELQNQLQEAAYYNGPVDGIYGLATQRAVLAFQEDQGFEPTGRLDNATWEALESFDPQAQAQVPAGESAEPITSPPSSAGELPPEGEPAISNDARPSTAEAAEAGSSNVGKVFGLGIGLAAVLASFGVGFFIANRSKSEAADVLGEGEEWSEAGLDAESANGSDATTPVYSNGSSSFAAGNGTVQNGMTAASSGVANGAMARIPEASQNGQLGGTAPLAKADIFDGLIKDLHNPDPHQRRKVIWELGQRGNSLAVQPLVDAMIDADSKEKSLVLAALSEIGMRSLRPMNRALAIALQDDNPEVRKNAIRDLTRIYELVVQISQMLGHAQEDEDPEVRQTASWALDQLNRIRQTQDIDSNMRSLPTTNGPKNNRFAL